MTSVGAYSIGDQPCDNFTPVAGYYGHPEHECFAVRRHTDPGATCDATVSFCINCHSDHHAWGYENCGKVSSWDEYREQQAKEVTP